MDLVIALAANVANSEDTVIRFSVKIRAGLVLNDLRLDYRRGKFVFCRDKGILINYSP